MIAIAPTERRGLAKSVSKEPDQMSNEHVRKPSFPRRLLCALAVSVAAFTAAIGASPASADFGVESFDVTFTNADGSTATQAGSHPFAMKTVFDLNTDVHPLYLVVPDEPARSLTVEQPEGLIGSPEATPKCPTIDFLEIEGTFRNNCSNETVIGYIFVRIGLFGEAVTTWPVYNLESSPGVPGRIGFNVLTVPVAVDVGLDTKQPYNLVASLQDISQGLHFLGSSLTLWGNPSDPVHDPYRGSCLRIEFHEGKTYDEVEPESEGNCPTGGGSRPFLTLPRSCDGPGVTNHSADSWASPGVFVSGSVLTHDASIPPNPQGFTGCGRIGFSPTISSLATSDSAETGTGLDFSVDVDDEGLTSPDGIADSEIKKAVVTLPQGVTINPSIGEGLGVCTPADLARETVSSAPGAGCPNSSKIGTLHVDTPIVDEGVAGSVFLAQQDDPATATPGAENPFDSLIALYLVLKNPNLGVNIKLPMKVEPDPRTGQLVSTLEDVPQVPFSRFEFHFREGQRAPLVTPPACGTYTTEAVFTPWANPDKPLTTTSSFQITEGVGGGPCPSGGIPPFHPDFEAGSINNNAKAFSPFVMRLLRADGEQDMTKFGSILPPGVLGKLAGVDKCSDQAIETAKTKTGREELASASCPANSQIGRTLAGAGLGSALTYVPGKVYLAGPHKGAPLSVVSVTPAVAGPFDAGTVVVRIALTLNPETAEVEVLGDSSDPIPHILKGIPLKMRDLRVYVDRDNFILNPTSCEESSARATLFGGYLDVFSAADDVSVDLATRYQAANCLNLGFKPRLRLKLKGGTRRGGHPALRAVLNARPGDANIGSAVVTLPRSAFLDQAHIRTICTRVQFAAQNCPKGSIYGHARAFTPLLDEPVEGPVYLRSSNNKLPDMVAALKGIVDVNVVGRIDSFKGGIRSSFETVPDAPVTKFVLTMRGGKKGLIVNSRNLCAGKNRAIARFVGQNGKPHRFRPVVRPSCGKKRKRGRHGRNRAR